MTTWQQRSLRWLIGLSILVSFVVIDMALEMRRVQPTWLFLIVVAVGWLMGWLLRFNRPWVWPIVLAVGLWVYPLVAAPYQTFVAVALPASAVVALAAHRMRDRRVVAALFGTSVTAVVLYFSSSYYLSAMLLFLSGIWCLLVGYGFLAAGSELAEPIAATTRNPDPAP